MKYKFHFKDISSSSNLHFNNILLPFLGINHWCYNIIMWFQWFSIVHPKIIINIIVIVTTHPKGSSPILRSGRDEDVGVVRIPVPVQMSIKLDWNTVWSEDLYYLETINVTDLMKMLKVIITIVCNRYVVWDWCGIYNIISYYI